MYELSLALSIASHKNYNPRQKSLARLDQIARKCVDKPLWRQKLVTSLDLGTPSPPPPPDNVGSEQ